MELNKIYQGDCLTVLKTFPDESVDMCMTSPPYWSLRDYGCDGQLGLEPTFTEYINKLCNIFDEVKRVLKKEGSCWVNIGDSYSTVSGGMEQLKRMGNDTPKYGEIDYASGYSGVSQLGKKNLEEKNLCLIPFRFAIEMQNRGWILRNTIIWYKRNCMPSSVTDRFTVDFEYLFFFVKNKKYWFEQQTEKHTSKFINEYKPRNADDKTRSATIQPRSETAFANPYNPNGRNKRCVWDITTKGYREAHFATYPEELCLTPIKAGCPVGGIVLDPFSGAGTTALVAKKLGRNYIGIELNPEYVTMSEKRLHNEAGLL